MTSPPHAATDAALEIVPQATAVGISGSPADGSRSRLLLEHALQRLHRRGLAVDLVDLAALPADGLLGRARLPEMESAIETVVEAQIVVASTPVYKGAYSGLLKIFCDRLPMNALAGRLAIPIATGAVPAHLLAVDQGLRALLTSLGARVVPTGTYGIEEQFADGGPQAMLLERLDLAVDEALALFGRAGVGPASAPPRAG